MNPGERLQTGVDDGLCRRTHRGREGEDPTVNKWTYLYCRRTVPDVLSGVNVVIDRTVKVSTVRDHSRVG